MISEKNHLYSGGLAEIVDKPSEVTFAYLSQWFRGSSSLGLALKLLKLPFVALDKSVLVMHEGELYIDLDVECETLYGSTIFKYGFTKTPEDTPKLSISPLSLLDFKKLSNSFKLLNQYALWLKDPEATLKMCRTFYENIQENSVFIEKEVWPYLIALDIVAEYFVHAIPQNLVSEVFAESAKRDWVLNSISDQYKVALGHLSFSQYISEYGLRADKDYELTCPRWCEIPDILEKRIQALEIVPIKKYVAKELHLSPRTAELFHVCVELQVLRSLARKKVLSSVYLLRKQLLENDKSRMKETTLIKTNKAVETTTKKSGKGRGVSVGKISGSVHFIDSVSNKVKKDEVVVFPNAGIDYSILYNKCSGIIFLKGGVSSHGAIVAREYRIPAIVAPAAKSLKSGVRVEIDGSTGSWKTV